MHEKPAAESRGSDDWHGWLATLAGETPGVAFSDPLTAILVWTPEGERLLWSSSAAAALRQEWQSEGEVRLPAELRARLRGLGDLTPGFRLERIRLGASPLAPPATIAWRRCPGPDGVPCLVTATGGRPVVRVAEMAEPVPVADLDVSIPGDPEPATVEPVRRAVRATWQADREARLTTIGPGLPGLSDGLGRSWAELVGKVVLDPDGAVAAAFAGETAWSRRPVRLRAPTGDRAVPAEMSGAPVLGPDGRLAGWRGYLLLPPVDAEGVPPGTFAPLAPPVRAPDIGPVEPLPPAFEDAFEAAAALTGTAGETVFGVLRAWLGPMESVPVPLPALPAFPPAKPEGSVAPEAPPVADASPLTGSERGALHEIARALGAGVEAELPAEEDEVRRSAEIVPLPSRPQPLEPAALLDRVPIGLAVFREAVPLFANRALLDRLGGRALPDLVGAGRLAPVLAALDGSDPPTSPPRVRLGREGEAELTYEVVAAPLRWGELPARLVSLVPADMAEPGPGMPVGAARSASIDDGSFATSERLAVAERALDLAEVGTLVLDGSGRIEAADPAAASLFGAAAGSLEGRDLTALLAPADHRTALACLDAARRGEAGSRHACDVEARPVGGRGRPLLMRAGRIDGRADPAFGVVFQDRSELLHQERVLREAQAAAAELAASRSAFLARISHEIRTPLTAIVGFTELMLEERFGPLGNERYRGYLRDILSSGTHVISLVNDLLDLAKVTAGKADLSPRALDLNELCRQCVALALPISARERAIVRTSFLPDLPRVVADERSVRQVVLNILANAIRYTGAGGQVIVSTQVTSPATVDLTIRDTGPGLSPDEIKAALTPFEQVARTRRTDGTGLGLPLSKALVEANGGAFRMTSARGTGTLVEIRLPRDPGRPEILAAE